jgi:hypothetical protein
MNADSSDSRFIQVKRNETLQTDLSREADLLQIQQTGKWPSIIE